VLRASTQAYDGVVPLPDGSGRLLCWRRNGQIWLGDEVRVDPTGSVLRVGGEPLVDLVRQDAAARGLRLAGVAVHYSTGRLRLFVSYYTTIITPSGSGSGRGLHLVVDQLSSASSWTWSGYAEVSTSFSFHSQHSSSYKGTHSVHTGEPARCGGSSAYDDHEGVLHGLA
jgi:hypothetical protein